MRNRGKRLCVVAVVASLFPDVARSNPLEAFGVGGRGPAMANAQAAEANDFSALFYNPAAMFQVPVADGLDTFSVTGSAAVDSLYIRDLAGSNISNPLTDSYGVGVGAVDGFGTDRFRVGILAVLPARRLQLQQTHFIDKREYRHSNRLTFEFYGERFQRQVILPGIAVRPFSFLSLGAGFSIFTDSRSDTTVVLPELADLSKAEINLQGDQKNTLAYRIGALFVPRPHLRIGGYYREGESFIIRGVSLQKTDPYDSTAKIARALGGSDEFGQPLDFRIQFQPATFGFGAAYDILTVCTVAADIHRSLWSTYLDNHNERPSPELKDTWIPRLGAEYRRTSTIYIRGGWSYEPSPVPKQSGATNVVDNDKHILAAGLSYRMPLEGYVAAFDVYGQLHLLLEQKQTKDPAFSSELDYWPETPEVIENPGYPGYVSGGRVYALGLSLSVGR